MALPPPLTADFPTECFSLAPLPSPEQEEKNKHLCGGQELSEPQPNEQEFPWDGNYSLRVVLSRV